ncbi:DUF1768-domain-containing protein [Serendipita vermifera]|nr:DUF1768-domain-containing protein [Serendipita vermifera]
MPRSPSDYVFFWKIDQEHGWASQWYKSKFSGPSTTATLQSFVAAEKQKLNSSTTAPTEPSTSTATTSTTVTTATPTVTTTESNQPDQQQDWITFMTAEHFMMYHKAMLFASTSTDPKITSTNTSVAQRLLTATNPKAVKDMGRLVKGFTDDVWHQHRSDIVLAGSILKFRQNPGLASKLRETGQKKLVEASPMDKIWGIGLDAKRASESLKADGEKRWGLNLLGLALEQARTILAIEVEEVQESAQSEPGPSN